MKLKKIQSGPFANLTKFFINTIFLCTVSALQTNNKINRRFEMRTIIPYWTTRNLNSDLMSDITIEMDRFINEFNHSIPVGAFNERNFAPPCEVTEADEYFFMSVDLPGMKKQDIKIEVNENTLNLSGERKRESKLDGKDKMQRYEKSYGYFNRSFTLPNAVDTAKVEAIYEDGVLELYLPKTNEAKSRQVEIKTRKNSFFDKLLGSRKDSSDMSGVN